MKRIGRRRKGSRKSAITSSLLRWYRKHGRDLPWRDEKDPYRILVSEIMLQQTQVSRVLTKYPEFLKRFSTFSRLARARTSEVIRSWSGLGYNSRVLRLHELSRIVVTDLKGVLPHDVEELMDLPGLGRYTAHAISCFAFDRRVPVVDTNIDRVLRRLYPTNGQRLAGKKTDIWTLAEHHLPRSSVHDWNQALMDLGSTICTASAPKCGECPLCTKCPSAFKPVRRTSSRSKSEPGRGGVPNRIYRGRAVEALRNLRRGDRMTSAQLARSIKPDFQRRDRRWFDLLVRGLERDGLIQIRSRQRISLPD